MISCSRFQANAGTNFLFILLQKLANYTVRAKYMTAAYPLE